MPYALHYSRSAPRRILQRDSKTHLVFSGSRRTYVYIREALRTWNAMAAWYRDRMSFNTTPTAPFYDLTTVPGTLIARKR